MVDTRFIDLSSIPDDIRYRIFDYVWEKKGIPRKRPEEFIEYGKRLSDKVDILLLHDSPWLEEYAGKIVRDERTAAVAIAIYEARPKLVFCGHLHLSP
uniref:Metallophosphatase family protein n=1 Tax=Ignisphaera aggregans TaxID=334771 RepID=A0A7C2ZUY4_9CREN